MYRLTKVMATITFLSDVQFGVALSTPDVDTTVHSPCCVNLVLLFQLFSLAKQLTVERCQVIV